MNYRIGILIYLLCLWGCSSGTKIQETGENQHLYIIDIDNAEKNEKIFLSEICSHVKTIILETGNNVLIGNVNGVQAYKNFIFILDDSRNNPGLYAFDREGKFIRKYGNKGNGPGEYLSTKDFTIDAENEIVYLLDDDADQILSYEINSGKYKNRIEIGERSYNCLHIQYHNEKLYTDINYWHINNNGCLLQEIDMSTGKQKQCWLDATAYIKG